MAKQRCRLKKRDVSTDLTEGKYINDMQGTHLPCSTSKKYNREVGSYHGFSK